MATLGNGRCPNALNDGVLTFEDGDATHWIPSGRNPFRTLTNEIIACPRPLWQAQSTVRSTDDKPMT